MTLLITSVLADTAPELICAAQAAWAGGAGAVELRIDALQGDFSLVAQFIREHPGRHWIVTCRTTAEGGRFAGPDEAMFTRLAACAGPNVSIDVEHAVWERSGRSSAQLKNAIAASAGLILSAHLLQRVDPGFDELCVHHLAVERAVSKVAYAGHDAADGFAAADMMHRHRRRVIAICMGEEGAWTRVLAKKLGAFGTFCTLSDTAGTALGQLTLSEMFDRFRWPAINERTKVYGVIGDPVAHSAGPLLFNRWFAQHGINAVYLPFHVRAGENALRRFLDGCLARPWLDCGGFSVTIPHKEAALTWLGRGANSMSRTIGAANTISFQADRPAGYNTDCYAAVDSLAAALGCGRVDLAGLTVDVLGAGGAARAVVGGLVEMGSLVTVYARNREAASGLAAQFQCTHRSWEARTARTGEVLINTTPLGMWTQDGAGEAPSPMPADALRGCRMVFDLVYRPMQTQLLKDATAAGCQALNGLDMFIRQAAMQFELWTGQSPDRELARRRLVAALVAATD
jgi:3-dehydroquinate dehydratase/shikimate dehydrogenase